MFCLLLLLPPFFLHFYFHFYFTHRHTYSMIIIIMIWMGRWNSLEKVRIISVMMLMLMIHSYMHVVVHGDMQTTHKFTIIIPTRNESQQKGKIWCCCAVSDEDGEIDAATWRENFFFLCHFCIDIKNYGASVCLHSFPFLLYFSTCYHIMLLGIWIVESWSVAADQCSQSRFFKLPVFRVFRACYVTKFKLSVRK